MIGILLFLAMVAVGSHFGWKWFLLRKMEGGSHSSKIKVLPADEDPERVTTNAELVRPEEQMPGVSPKSSKNELDPGSKGQSQNDVLEDYDEGIGNTTRETTERALATIEST